MAIDAKTVQTAFDQIKKLTDSGVGIYKAMDKARRSTPSGAFTHFKENVLPLSLGLGAIGVATSQTDKALESAKDMIGDVKATLGLSKKIDNIISLQPALGQFDRDKVILYYEQLRHFAPDVASNDLAAASYIKHALAMHDAGIPIATYETLAKTQKQLDGSRPGTGRGPIASSILSGSGFKSTDDGNVYDFKPFFDK